MFVFLNQDAVKYTGFSGWLNINNRNVIFCGRLSHLKLIEEGSLEGVDGRLVYEPQSAGGPEGTSWADIRRWCAEKGWCHFVTHSDKDLIEFVCHSKDQEKICSEFARDANARPFFKFPGLYKKESEK